MGPSAATAGLILLGFIHLSAGNGETCELYATVGQNLNLPFDYEGLTKKHGLKWTHNTTAVYSRQKDTVTKGKVEDVSGTGSLQLKNLQYSDAGIYKVTVLHVNGSEAASWTRRLCIKDKVTKPQLTYVCDSKSGFVTLTCGVSRPGLEFSWTIDKVTLKGETRHILRLPLRQVKGKSFTCAVDNKASKADSDVVRPDCISPTPPPPAQVCLPSKTFGAVLAGGGGLILVLLLIIIALCCRNKRAQTQKGSGGKVELRSASVNKVELRSISPDYETMHMTEDYPSPSPSPSQSPSPSPRPSPRTRNKQGAEPHAQNENRPAPLAPASEELKASPVPKPRTKINQTPNL